MAQDKYDEITSLFIKASIGGSCLISSILLYERLYKEGYIPQLVQGYFITESGCYGRHYWVKCDNQDLDVAQQVSKVLLNKTGLRLTQEEPTHLVRIDSGTPEDRLALEDLDNTYLYYCRKGLRALFRRYKPPQIIYNYARQNRLIGP